MRFGIFAANSLGRRVSASHRYWRIYARRNAGDGSFIQFAEVEMRETAGGADQCTGGTAAASASPQSGSAAGAFADDGTTSWIQWSGTTDKWVSYDFGSGIKKNIVEVVITGAVGAAARSPGEFDVQWSDDNSTWTTAFTCSARTGWTINVARTFTKVTTAAARYWRLRLDENFQGGGAVMGLGEMEMKETVGGSDQCTGGTPSATTTFGGLAASNAFADDDATTYWGTNAGANDSEALIYDFGSGVTKNIVEVTVLPRNDSALNWQQAPRSGWIERSSDGLAWVTTWSFLNQVGDRTYTMRIIKPSELPAPPVGTHRFWGIKTNSIQNGTTVFGIAEIELRGSVGGADLCTGGSAVCLNPWVDSSSTSAATAFDNSNATEYGANAVSAIIAYDFGVGNGVAQPQQVRLRARSGSNNGQAPTDFDLVYSDDGQTWTVARNFTSPATWASSEERLFS